MRVRVDVYITVPMPWQAERIVCTALLTAAWSKGELYARIFSAMLLLELLIGRLMLGLCLAGGWGVPGYPLCGTGAC